MIVKMKFLSISGPRTDIDRVSASYLSKYEMQLENAITELKTTDNLMPFMDVNPYKEPLSKAEQYVLMLAQPKGEMDTSLTADEILTMIRDLNHDYLDLKAREDRLKKQKEELPDYTVANMDVDGMPWNSRRPWQIFPGDPSKSRKEFDVKVPEPGMENEVPDDLSAFQNPPMTKEERRGIIWLSLKASLTVGLIFGGAAFIFILFCVFVWLK